MSRQLVTYKIAIHFLSNKTDEYAETCILSLQEKSTLKLFLNVCQEDSVLFYFQHEKRKI